MLVRKGNALNCIYPRHVDLAPMLSWCLVMYSEWYALHLWTCGFYCWFVHARDVLFCVVPSELVFLQCAAFVLACAQRIGLYLVSGLCPKNTWPPRSDSNDLWISAFTCPRASGSSENGSCSYSCLLKVFHNKRSPYVLVFSVPMSSKARDERHTTKQNENTARRTYSHGHRQSA